MNEVSRDEADQENRRWMRDHVSAYRAALHAKEEAESIAREKRDNYVAATLGRAGDELPEKLREVEAAYLYQRMVQAALEYANAANRAAIAAEHYEELVVDEASTSV